MARAVMLKVKEKKRKRLARKRGLMRLYLRCRKDSARGCFSRSWSQCLQPCFKRVEGMAGTSIL